MREFCKTVEEIAVRSAFAKPPGEWDGELGDDGLRRGVDQAVEQGAVA